MLAAVRVIRCYILIFQTDKTVVPVDTQNWSAVWTCSAFWFENKEVVNTFILYYCQVFNKTCFVFCPVPFIKLFQSFARICFTVVAELWSCPVKIITRCNYAPFNWNSFVRRINPATGTLVFDSEISNACPAIHSTWSYQGFVKVCSSFHPGYYLLLILSLIFSKFLLNYFLLIFKDLQYFNNYFLPVQQKLQQDSVLPQWLLL